MRRRAVGAAGAVLVTAIATLAYNLTGGATVYDDARVVLDARLGPITLEESAAQRLGLPTGKRVAVDALQIKGESSRARLFATREWVELSAAKPQGDGVRLALSVDGQTFLVGSDGKLRLADPADTAYDPPSTDGSLRLRSWVRFRFADRAQERRAESPADDVDIEAVDLRGGHLWLRLADGVTLHQHDVGVLDTQLDGEGCGEGQDLLEVGGGDVWWPYADLVLSRTDDGSYVRLRDNPTC